MGEKKVTYPCVVHIYKIWWEDTPGRFYIGSTFRDVDSRIRQHMTSSASGKSRLYVHMRKKGRDFMFFNNKSLPF